MKIIPYNEITNSQLLMRTFTPSEIGATVADIIKDVAANGDEALFRYAKKFDNAALTALEVTESEMDTALASVSPELLEVMQQAAENIRAFHAKQIRTGFCFEKEMRMVRE